MCYVGDVIRLSYGVGGCGGGYLCSVLYHKYRFLLFCQTGSIFMDGPPGTHLPSAFSNVAMREGAT